MRLNLPKSEVTIWSPLSGNTKTSFSFQTMSFFQQNLVCVDANNTIHDNSLPNQNRTSEKNTKERV